MSRKKDSQFESERVKPHVCESPSEMEGHCVLKILFIRVMCCDGDSLSFC